MRRRAFTMIELIFVIVVLGILAAIAVPKLAATRTDAEIAKGAADVASIRSGIISVRQKYLLKGQTGYINFLSHADLFDGNGTAGTEILMYPVTAATGHGHWNGTTGAGGNASYTYQVHDKVCNFKYTPATGRFDLDPSGANYTHEYCKALVGK